MNTDPWEFIRQIYERNIPFHELLGLKVVGIEAQAPKIIIEKKDKFVGNFMRGNLHGGVISSLLDIAGGVVALVDSIQLKSLKTRNEMIEQFSRMSTIDIRVDYLRPGLGNQFIASALVLRTGNKLSVTRMELHNDQNALIAVGTGTYIVG